MSPEGYLEDNDEEGDPEMSLGVVSLQTAAQGRSKGELKGVLFFTPTLQTDFIRPSRHDDLTFNRPLQLVNASLGPLPSFNHQQTFAASSDASLSPLPSTSLACSSVRFFPSRCFSLRYLTTSASLL